MLKLQLLIHALRLVTMLTVLGVGYLSLYTSHTGTAIGHRCLLQKLMTVVYFYALVIRSFVAYVLQCQGMKNSRAAVAKTAPRLASPKTTC